MAKSNAEIVGAWFQEKIATGAIARDTPAYNQALAAKADLVARLDANSAPAAPAPPPPPPPPAPAAPPAAPKA